VQRDRRTERASTVIASILLAQGLAAQSALGDEPLPSRADMDPSPSGRLGLGLGVKAVKNVILVSRVVPDSAAASAELHVGQRIVALDGQAVRGLIDLERRLEDRRAGDRLDIEVRAVAPEYRVGALATGALWTGRAGTESGFVGGMYGQALASEILYGVVAVGYVAVGDRPFYGRNVLSAAVGAELDIPIIDHVSAIGRGLAWYNAALGEGVVPGRWPLEPIGFSVHGGMRVFGAEAFFSTGLGPARGLNLGGGAALTIGFGGASVDDQGDSVLF
jgi:hypothetical protein